MLKAAQHFDDLRPLFQIGRPIMQFSMQSSRKFFNRSVFIEIIRELSITALVFLEKNQKFS